MMKISLILTSADRIEDLKRFFLSLLSQNLNDFKLEIIFVNQGSYSPISNFSFLEGIEYIEVKTTMIGLSRARNIGLAKVTGDIIGFPDDDCWYSLNILNHIYNYFSQHPTIDAICTNVYDPDTQRTYGGRPLNLHTPIGIHNLFQLPISVGIFVRAAAFRVAGYEFDERLGAGTPLGSGEETDMIYRLLKIGARVEYVGSLQVYHPVPVYQVTDVDKYYRYGLGFGYLNGRILRNLEWGVIPHLGHVLLRSLGGCMIFIYSSTKRRLYWNRFRGVCQGFVLGVRGGRC